MEQTRETKKKKIIKYSLLTGGAIALSVVSYLIGYEKSGNDIVKLVESGESTIVDFKNELTGKVTSVYMHMES